MKDFHYQILYPNIRTSVIVAQFSIFSSQIALVFSLYLTSLSCLQNRQIFSESFYPGIYLLSVLWEVLCWISHKCSSFNRNRTWPCIIFVDRGVFKVAFGLVFKKKIYLCTSFWIRMTHGYSAISWVGIKHKVIRLISASLTSCSTTKWKIKIYS